MFMPIYDYKLHRHVVDKRVLAKDPQFTHLCRTLPCLLCQSHFEPQELVRRV